MNLAERPGEQHAHGGRDRCDVSEDEASLSAKRREQPHVTDVVHLGLVAAADNGSTALRAPWRALPLQGQELRHRSACAAHGPRRLRASGARGAPRALAQASGGRRLEGVDDLPDAGHRQEDAGEARGPGELAGPPGQPLVVQRLGEHVPGHALHGLDQGGGLQQRVDEPQGLAHNARGGPERAKLFDLGPLQPPHSREGARVVVLCTLAWRAHAVDKGSEVLGHMLMCSVAAETGGGGACEFVDSSSKTLSGTALRRPLLCRVREALRLSYRLKGAIGAGRAHDARAGLSWLFAGLQGGGGL
mmetsp:Transcript_10289/g.32466  ORF Transcript_10289/g.32466 Transcript_10289/m.32466 type:complete len:303 (+) Transcript_10289:1210-2118(+)